MYRGCSRAEEEDYTPQSGQLTIGAGQRTGTIVIRAVDDDVLEPRESFRVTLTSASPTDVVTVPPDYRRRIPPSTASDGPVLVSVADVTVDEGESGEVHRIA